MTADDDQLRQLEEQLTKPPPVPTRGFLVVRPIPRADSPPASEAQVAMERMFKVMGAAFVSAHSADVAAAVIYRIGGLLQGQDPEDFSVHGIVYYVEHTATEIRDGYWCVPQGRILCYDPPPDQ